MIPLIFAAFFLILGHYVNRPRVPGPNPPTAEEAEDNEFSD